MDSQGVKTQAKKSPHMAGVQQQTRSSRGNCPFFAAPLRPPDEGHIRMPGACCPGPGGCICRRARAMSGSRRLRASASTGPARPGSCSRSAASSAGFRGDGLGGMPRAGDEAGKVGLVRVAAPPSGGEPLPGKGAVRDGGAIPRYRCRHARRRRSTSAGRGAAPMRRRSTHRGNPLCRL